MVKWTTPCSGLSENDPKLYTNFEFYEIESHKHIKKHMNLQSQPNYVHKKLYIYRQDECS